MSITRILSECCRSDTAISDLLKWFLVPSLQSNPILISQLVLVKPKVGEKGWGTGLMYAHQFLNSVFMFPGIKAHAAWLIYESHNIPQSLLPQLQLCHWGCLTGNLKPYQGQGQQGSSLVISSKGCYRDYFPRLLALPTLHCIRVRISALHALLDCYPLRAPGMLTPTFDQPCQFSPPHHSAPVPLICSPHYGC